MCVFLVQCFFNWFVQGTFETVACPLLLSRATTEIVRSGAGDCAFKLKELCRLKTKLAKVLAISPLFPPNKLAIKSLQFEDTHR
jgi:hypothetical protein